MSGWSLKHHIEVGREALREIEERGLASGSQPICHHFSSSLDRNEVDFGQHFASLEQALGLQGIEFDTFSLEAWEKVSLTDKWLEERIPAMVSITERDGLVYQGWSCEPHGIQPVNATDFRIVNVGSGS